MFIAMFPPVQFEIFIFCSGIVDFLFIASFKWVYIENEVHESVSLSVSRCASLQNFRHRFHARGAACCVASDCKRWNYTGHFDGNRFQLYERARVQASANDCYRSPRNATRKAETKRKRGLTVTNVAVISDRLLWRVAYDRSPYGLSLRGFRSQTWQEIIMSDICTTTDMPTAVSADVQS